MNSANLQLTLINLCSIYLTLNLTKQIKFTQRRKELHSILLSPITYQLTPNNYHLTTIT